jgi:hypothetical protein
MMENNPLPVNGTAESHAAWPTLIGRTINDVSRILRSELQMFQANVADVLEARLTSTVALLAISVAMMGGLGCLVCASILLLHRWLFWWQALGIAGMSLLLTGLTSHAIMRRLRVLK